MNASNLSNMTLRLHERCQCDSLIRRDIVYTQISITNMVSYIRLNNLFEFLPNGIQNLKVHHSTQRVPGQHKPKTILTLNLCWSECWPHTPSLGAANAAPCLSQWCLKLLLPRWRPVPGYQRSVGFLLSRKSCQRRHGCRIPREKVLCAS